MNPYWQLAEEHLSIEELEAIIAKKRNKLKPKKMTALELRRIELKKELLKLL